MIRSSYVKTEEGWLNLCVVLDFYSRVIIGWSMSERMQATLLENAIVSAVNQSKSIKDAIFHSDKGSQYCSDKVIKLLKTLKFKQRKQISLCTYSAQYHAREAHRTLATVVGPRPKRLPPRRLLPSIVTNNHTLTPS